MMTRIDPLEIPNELYTHIRGMALSQSRSINEQIVELLQSALAAELQRQTQVQVLREIDQTRWSPPASVSDSVTVLRKVRGYDD